MINDAKSSSWPLCERGTTTALHLIIGAFYTELTKNFKLKTKQKSTERTAKTILHKGDF